MIRNTFHVLALISLSWCYFQNISANEPVKAVPPAKDLINSKWHEYTNAEYGFKISYPAALVAAEKDRISDYSTVVYDSKVWSFESNDHGNVITVIPTLNLRNYRYYPNSFLAAVHIGVSNDPKVVKSCLVCDEDDQEAPVIINGTAFQVCNMGDGGAGSMTDGMRYRAVHNNQCFSIEQIQSGPNGHGSFDKASHDIPDEILQGYYYLAGKIITTFKFTN